MSNLLRSPKVPQETLWRTVGPSGLPVTLAQAKEHLNLSPSDTTHDSKLTSMIAAATVRVEHDTERCLLLQTFEKRRFEFPRYKEPVTIDRKPLKEVQTVTYLDENGDSQTLDPAEYDVDEAQRALFPVNGWPATNKSNRAVVVTFVAGYGAASNVPDELKSAILLQLDMRFYGEDVNQQYEDLIRPYKRTSYP
jgi:uncharacterized phiE125 gp8 family phage protein